jgi:hypothetical protein
MINLWVGFGLKKLNNVFGDENILDAVWLLGKLVERTERAFRSILSFLSIPLLQFAVVSFELLASIGTSWTRRVWIVVKVIFGCSTTTTPEVRRVLTSCTP